MAAGEEEAGEVVAQAGDGIGLRGRFDAGGDVVEGQEEALGDAEDAGEVPQMRPVQGLFP
ncbi:hypothetical protein [Streptomyces sp. CA-253872]|uniref:hypothetical protein n=1 Tax=Streptomyces sp. CA-253872 TaxID=3240067 RepID=UPI003D8AE50E